MTTYTEDDIREAFAFSFMKPEICHGDYFRLVTSDGAEIVPADMLGHRSTYRAEDLAPYVEGKADDPTEIVEMKTGWFARMSASGYLDCTPWGEYPSEAAARQYLIETYGD